ncbi:MAG: type II secretion system F family protein [Venatoribacter sp.]
MATKKEEKDLTFSWQGKDRKGKNVSGILTGLNPTMVKAQLRKQGITATKIRKKSDPLLGSLLKTKVKSSDVTIFVRQMATMIKSGVPLVQSFDIVAEGIDNIAMKEVVRQLRDSVASGNNFAEALKQHPDHFDDLTCNLVASGEESGALETMLDKVAVYKEKTESLKKKIKKALMYPAITLLIAFVVTVILLVKVVPSFQEMFNNFGAELPAPTQFVVWLSNMAQAYWLPIIGVLVAAGIIFSQLLKRSPEFRDAFDAFTLKVPVFGELAKKAAVARFARVLSTTFAAGVPLVEALKSVSGAVGNAVFRDAVMQVQGQVAEGQQMHFAMRNTNVFPNMVVQMTSIGEEAGSLDSMLGKAANYYEEEVDVAVDGMTAMLEPMVMAFLGVVIGGLIVAMYLPIFQMGQAV